MSKETDKLFNDPQIEYPIREVSLPFSEYILISRDIISKNRKDLNQNPQKIIEANSPFEYRPQKPNNQGILLIHGLFDSPLILQDFGRKLAECGYLVRAILLPGHGTVPGALLNVRYEDWLAAVDYGVQSFNKDVHKIHVLGFSLGGALALMQPHLASYTLLAPVFKIRSMFAGTANRYRALEWVWKDAAWFYKDPQETIDYAKYRSVPFNAVYQVYLLTKLLQKVKPTAPCFFAVTQNDMTVCSKATINYFKKETNARSRMILYTPDQNLSVDAHIQTRSSIHPEYQITDFSHPCIPISPNNAHYGKSGDFPFASLEPTHSNINYGEFSALQLQINRIALKYHLTTRQYQRLSFNPDFEFLSNNIVEFIHSC